MRIKKTILYIVSIVLLALFILYVGGYRWSAGELNQELNREMKYTPSTIVYNKTFNKTAIVVSKYGSWIICRPVQKEFGYLWKSDGKYLEPINLEKQDQSLSEEEIITDYANQCLWLKDPIPDVAIREAALKSISIGFVSSMTSFKVDSRKYASSGVQTKSSIEFESGEATVTGVVTTWFKMAKYGWVVDTSKFTATNVSVKTEPLNSNIMSEYDKVNQLLSSHEFGFFPIETKPIGSQLDLAHGKATYIIKKSTSVGSWSAALTYSVLAEYKFPTGWEYNVPDWKFVETIDWAGTWNITLFNRNANGVQVREVKAQIKNMVITGDISQSSTPGNMTYPSTLKATFTLNGKTYTVPGVVDPDDSITMSSVRRIIFKYGPSNDEQIGMQYVFGDNTGTGQAEASYSSSGLGYYGGAEKVK